MERPRRAISAGCVSAAVALLVIIGCVHQTPKAADLVAPPSDFKLVLRRTSCFICPTYEVRVDASGLATFSSEHDDAFVREAHAELTDVQMSDIVAAIERSGFWTLSSKTHRDCPTVRDSTTNQIQISAANRRHEVTMYWSCRGEQRDRFEALRSDLVEILALNTVLEGCDRFNEGAREVASLSYAANAPTPFLDGSTEMLLARVSPRTHPAPLTRYLVVGRRWDDEDPDLALRRARWLSRKIVLEAGIPAESLEVMTDPQVERWDTSEGGRLRTGAVELEVLCPATCEDVAVDHLHHGACARFQAQWTAPTRGWAVD